MKSIRVRLKKVLYIKERLAEDLGHELSVYQIAYLSKVCDKLLELSKKEPVTHADIDITMAILFERHEHYKELNRDREG